MASLVVVIPVIKVLLVFLALLPASVVRVVPLSTGPRLGFSRRDQDGHTGSKAARVVTPAVLNRLRAAPIVG